MASNNKIIGQWASGLAPEKALNELTELKVKYPWLKCDETMKLLTRLSADLPKVVKIVDLQDRQNRMHGIVLQSYGIMDTLKDETRVIAIAKEYGIDLES